MSRLSVPTERKERRNLFGPKASGSRGYASLTPPNGADQPGTEEEQKTRAAEEVRQDLEEDANREADDELDQIREEEYDSGVSATNDDLSGPDGVHQTQENDIDQQSEAARESETVDAGVDSRWNTPSEDLTNVMRTLKGEAGVRRVWGIYSALDAQTRANVDLRCQLILWHSKQETDTAAQRALDLFHGLDEAERTRPGYTAAIAAAMYLNKTRQAIQLHREAAHAKGHDPFGSGLLMRHAISARDWTLAVEVMRIVQSGSPTRSPIRRIFSTQDVAAHEPLSTIEPFRKYVLLFRLLKHVPIEGRFPGQLLHLVQYINQVWSDRSTRHDLQSLLVALLRHYTIRGICQKRSLQDVVPAYRLLRDVFITAHSMDVLFSSAYEYCIAPLARMENPPSPSQHYGLISFLYRQYSESKAFKPSSRTLNSMLHAWSARRLSATGSNMSGLGVQEKDIIEDWRRFHGAIDKSMVFLLMETYARLGEVEEVEKHAQQYKTTLGPGLRDASALWPVMYVHAVRRDTKSALQALDSMQRLFGVEPNVRCWNIAIYAFERTNDLEGAKFTLQRLLQTEVHPDEYSFGPVLSLCGKYGDVEGAREMLDLAAQYNVTPSTLMLNGLIVAYATSGDIASAETSLTDAAESVRSGRAHGPLTMCYNTLMAAFALRRDTRGTMRVYSSAKQDGITLDATSYSALMRALCLVRKTDQAEKILKDVMRAQNVRPSSYHYAVIMLGYLGQRMPREALETHYDMCASLVRESSSTRAAYLKAKSMIEARDAAKFGDSPQFDDPANRPLTETINDLMETMHDEDKLSYQKGIQPGISDTSPQGIASASFEYLINLHGDRQCFDAVTQLFEQWRQNVKQDDHVPVRMITALMQVQLRAGQYSEVERYWGLIQDEVVRLQKKQRPQEPQDTDDDGRARISPPTTETSPNLPLDPLPVFGRLLSHPLQIYLQALSQHDDPPVAQMTTTFTWLLSSGYTIDNLTWNTYITILCQVEPPRALLAFTLVERFLIDEFPGWSRPLANLRGWNGYFSNKASTAQGMQYTKARYLRPDQLMPQYRTFVHLAGALLQLRAAENLGGYRRRRVTQEERDVKAQIGTIREIRKRAPKTLAAVTNMPTVHDDLQRDLIRNDVGADG